MNNNHLMNLVSGVPTICSLCSFEFSQIKIEQDEQSLELNFVTQLSDETNK